VTECSIRIHICVLTLDSRVTTDSVLHQAISWQLPFLETHLIVSTHTVTDVCTLLLVFEHISSH